MWRVDKVEPCGEGIGHYHLTRLGGDGQPLSEKLTIPMSLNPGFSWSDAPEVIEDNEVISLLCGVIKGMTEVE